MHLVNVKRPDVLRQFIEAALSRSVVPPYSVEITVELSALYSQLEPEQDSATLAPPKRDLRTERKIASLDIAPEPEAPVTHGPRKPFQPLTDEERAARKCSVCGNPPKRYLCKGKCERCYSRERMRAERGLTIKGDANGVSVRVEENASEDELKTVPPGVEIYCQKCGAQIRPGEHYRDVKDGPDMILHWCELCSA